MLLRSTRLGQNWKVERSGSAAKRKRFVKLNCLWFIASFLCIACTINNTKSFTVAEYFSTKPKLWKISFTQMQCYLIYDHSYTLFTFCSFLNSHKTNKNCIYSNYVERAVRTQQPSMDGELEKVSTRKSLHKKNVLLDRGLSCDY